MNHKEKCKALKKVRKNIADVLGVDLHQTECTYAGDCPGTCPKCKQEEMILNKAILTGSAVAASSLLLTGCELPAPISNDIAGEVSVYNGSEDMGDMSLPPEDDPSYTGVDDDSIIDEPLMGDVADVSQDPIADDDLLDDLTLMGEVAFSPDDETNVCSQDDFENADDENSSDAEDSLDDADNDSSESENEITE